MKKHETFVHILDRLSHLLMPICHQTVA